QHVKRFLRLPNDKLIIVGSFTHYNSVVRSRIARLNPNGSLDTDFSPTSGANNTIHDVKLTHDGRLLIGGDFTTYFGTSISGIARIYP
ncbi:MAG: delta-60 repeat domain-containing protein, partial [Leptospiraceae bacterium]|nr:delta-60 repeat domain-containing protein [Leptospiraceae bacterium]